MKTLYKVNKNLLKELTKKLGNLRSDRSRNAHQIRLVKEKIRPLLKSKNKDDKTLLQKLIEVLKRLRSKRSRNSHQIRLVKKEIGKL